MADGKCVSQDEGNAGYSSDYADYLDCNTDDNLTGVEGYNSTCTAASNTRLFCIKASDSPFWRQASGLGADQELYAMLGSGTRPSSEVRGFEYAEATGTSPDDELSSGEESTAIFAWNNSDYRNLSDGYYISPVFLATENLDWADFLQEGDIGIYYENFFYYNETYTFFHPAETVAEPRIVDLSDGDTEAIAELLEAAFSGTELEL